MKKFLAVVLFCLPAFGQAAYSGHGLYSGSAAYGSSVSGGGPLTYSARTDNCATGAETGCVGGRTAGQAGSAMSFMYRPTDTVPFANLAPANTSATDPDFNTYMVMATDTSAGANPYVVFFMGSSGNWASFNQDSTLFLAETTGGGTWVYQINPTLIHAKGCSPSTPCVTQSEIKSGTTNPSSTTQLLTGGSWGWSSAPGETNVLFERSSDGLSVYKDTINTSGAPSAWTLTRVLDVDFTSDTPVPCSILPVSYTNNWTSTWNTGVDGSITEGITGGQDWQSGWTPTVTDTFILPQQSTIAGSLTSGTFTAGEQIKQGTTNATAIFQQIATHLVSSNVSGSEDATHTWVGQTSGAIFTPTAKAIDNKKGFQATSVSGATTSPEPDWSTCTTTCSDGGVTWTTIGTLSGQGPGFDVVSYQPGVGCSRINTRLGKIYRGTGNAQPAGYWTTDDDITCARMGQTPPGCSLGDTMTMHEASQMFDPAFALFSPTGGGSVGCLVPGTCSCAETNSTYQGAWSSGTTYAVHDLVFYNTSWYQSKTAHTNSSHPDTDTTDWKVDDAYCYNYMWQKNSLNVRSCTMIGGASSAAPNANNSCDGHTEKGYSSLYAGGKLYSHYYSQPTIGGGANRGVQMLPAPLPADYHSSYQNVSPGDQQPMMMARTDVPTSTANYTAAGYAEDTMLTTDGSEKMYRMMHNYCTGSSPTFGIQNCIGGISQDGTLAAVATDMMGTRGSTSHGWAGTTAYALGDTIFPTSGNAANIEFLASVAGTSSGTQPTWSTCTTTCTDGGVTWTNTGKSCNNLRAYFAPAASTHFNTGDTIMPVTNNTGGEIYQAQSPGGTTGPTIPNWNAACPNYGDACAIDGTVNWKNVGPNTCRGDIVMMDLLSAHAAP